MKCCSLTSIHSRLDLAQISISYFAFVSIVQTGWWTGGTARWNGKVQWWQLERKSMLPSRICQRMRRSNNCSLDHVKKNKNKKHYNNKKIIFFQCYYSYIVPFCRYSLFPLLTNNRNIKRNRSVHQKYFWQIFISKDEGDDASLCCLLFF